MTASTEARPLQLAATPAESQPPAEAVQDLLRFVVVGSVDDGKSTLIGRLLYETGGLYEDQVTQVQRASRMGGAIDFSLFTDGLRAEREQGITIDVAYRYFSTPKRRFIIADTPGHVQYTRNMATGASTADLAVILIDARQGVMPQSRRHATIASVLGIPRLAVAVNKMDLMGYQAKAFDRIREAFEGFARQLGFAEVCFFPISAPQGDNLVVRSARTPWFHGPSLLEYLEGVPVGEGATQRPMRFPVQVVLRPDLGYRAFAGRLTSGTIGVGDEVVALPSGRRTRVSGIDTFEGQLERAFAPMSVSLRLADEIDLSRGDLLCDPVSPPAVSCELESRLIWLSERPLDPARGYLVKHCARTVSAHVERVLQKTDLETLEPVPAEKLEMNDIGTVVLRTHRPLVFDAYREDRATGAFILIDALTNATVAAGTILGRGPASDEARARAELGRVGLGERARRLGHRGGVVVAPALALAGLERELFDSGILAALSNDLASAAACARAGLVALVAGPLPPADLAWLRQRLGVDLAVLEPHADDPHPAARIMAVLRAA